MAGMKDDDGLLVESGEWLSFLFHFDVASLSFLSRRYAMDTVLVWMGGWMTVR